MRETRMSEVTTTQENVMRAAGRCKHANMAAGCSPGWMSGTAQNPPCTSKEGQGPNRQSRVFWVRQVQGHKGRHVPGPCRHVPA